MTILNIFANQSGQIPLSELDTNFATPITIGTTPIILGQTAGTITGLTLAGANLGTPTGNLANCTFPILNQNTTGTASNVTGVVIPGNGGTGLSVVGTSGNVLTSTGTAWASTAPASISLTTGVTGILPIANGGTNSSATATAGGIGYGTGTAIAVTAAGTAGQALISNGAGAPSWGVAGATVTTTSTNASFYPVFNASTSGSLTTANVNSSFTYNPSLGTLLAPQVQATNGIVMNNNAIASSFTFATGANGMSVGPVTINSGVVITVPSTQRWVVL
jgi:hypothetical protein